MSPQEHLSDASAHTAERAEGRWASVSVAIVVLLVVLAAGAGIYHETMPQARVETVDPREAPISGEFIESNLGSQLEPDGSVTVRALGQRYSFTPSCIAVPADTPITIRATSADVIHGMLIEGTNINTMLIPGYVSVITAQFGTPGEHPMPCQEFCSVGHEGMWGRVKVIDKAAFKALADKTKRVSCVGE
jgi:cytochrome c oxidase subunit II